MMTSLTRFLNIVLVALLAGTSFGIWIGLNPTDYTPATYIEQQQNLVKSLNTLMVSLVVVATIITIVSAFLHRQSKLVFFSLLSAATFLATCIVISRFGNLPIQTEMLTWNSASLPENWTEMRDKWWSFHIMRTVAELIALTIVSWTSAFAQAKI